MSHAVRFRCVLVALLASFVGLVATAQSAPPSKAPGSVVDLAPVVVSGVLPGPALWKVSKGDHVMWVLGLVEPLPRKMQWESAKVEGLVATSQQVLELPRLAVGARVGFWGRLALIPSMIGIKKLPDGQTLKDVLSPDLYSRWQVQADRLLGGSSSADRLRPVFAGKKLYAAAIKRSNLTADGDIENLVYKAAKRNNVTLTDPSYVMVMKDPRADAKLFKSVSMDDQQCLTGVLDAIGNDLSQATDRANAWATGDLAALKGVLSTQQQDGCLSAIGATDAARKLGMTDITQRMKQTWLKAAEAAIAKDRQSLAVLPMVQVMSSDGYVAALKAAGYTVTSPND